ncbi:DUF2252 domain-containing protein [Allostreptomyces psammosilenae]|uniref:Uncharacterized protein (DUF2252 family) n=1 Tax=Allostreptomyces psammosilenae TaxID=1892865 RepID=A0A853A4E4_9ACTN|nr:DUF2252 domain-containing protein [Allostreptomyces psammosilenae]NYI05372.1 uncharacterized protein (DUF2252 family) [Allostreptomyces psammosilenae]
MAYRSRATSGQRGEGGESGGGPAAAGRPWDTGTTPPPPPWSTDFAQPPGFAQAAHGGSPRQDGKRLRRAVPRAAHAALPDHADRPSVVEAVRESNVGRLEHLVPIRIGRMAASPFAFLRGTAALMAADLAHTPVTGITAQLCGDAHAGNFGLYGDARDRLTIDINDFDETVPGPWEWDLKRLAASHVLAGRQAGAAEDVCREAAFHAVGAYRRTMRALAGMSAADAWNAIPDEELVSYTDAHDLRGTLRRVVDKARRNTSARFAARSSERQPDGRWRFVPAPPVLENMDDELVATVVEALGEYAGTVAPDRRPLLTRYTVHDVAFRVVGTGSVGLRSYVVMLRDHQDEALVLQVKEARPSVLVPHLERIGHPVEPAGHEGRRVVLGQKRMQVVSDILLGWTTVDGRHFQVRQFRNRKGSIDPVELAPDELDDYARMTGALLARAHAHTADPRLLAGYCGKNEELDEAVAAFAVAYADRTERDHAELLAAVRSGRLAAEGGVTEAEAAAGAAEPEAATSGGEAFGGATEAVRSGTVDSGAAGERSGGGGATDDR